MSRQRWILFLSLTAAFVLVALTLSWNFIYSWMNEFPAGTRPTLEQPKEKIPVIPILRTTDPAQGSPSEKAVLVVEVADFACISCRILESELKKALTTSAVPVRLVWRDAPPLEQGPLPILLSLGARCAGDQKRFWPMHDAILRSAITDLKSLEAVADQVVNDTEAFHKCMTSGKYIQQIQEDAQDAITRNITPNPTLFIGKKILGGTATAQQIQNAVEQAYKP